MKMRKNQTEKLREVLKEKKFIPVPSCFDTLSAKLIEQANFDVTFMSGFAASASRIGSPDLGLMTFSEVLDQANNICNAIDIPMIVDGDTGYGNSVNVFRTVRGYADAGAAGVMIEDQKWPKRCGHMQGKQVIPKDEYAEKLQAALDARKNKDFIIVARTDARATEGLDAAIERGLYYRKIGADVIFIEAPKTIQEMKKIGKAIDAPLVANMIEGGATPIVSESRLHNMGFKIVLYPLSVLFSNTHATLQILRELKRTGGTGKLKKKMVNFDQFNEFVELTKYKKLEKRYKKEKKTE